MTGEKTNLCRIGFLSAGSCAVTPLISEDQCPYWRCCHCTTRFLDLIAIDEDAVCKAKAGKFTLPGRVALHTNDEFLAILSLYILAAGNGRRAYIHCDVARVGVIVLDEIDAAYPDGYTKR